MKAPACRVAVSALLALAAAPGPASGANLRVRGNKLVDGSHPGHVVQLRGVNRSGLEYQCIQGDGFFESPHPGSIDDPAMIQAMKSWNINVVRVPLNADCWLGIKTPKGFGGARYRRIVRRYVGALNAAHLYVILDLHWTAPRRAKASGLIPMADAEVAPRFWHSLAHTFKRNHAVLFDLFNEPFKIGWRCWLRGCPVGSGHTKASHWPRYRAAGMQRLVRAVRSAGATQPLLLGGLDYALDVSGWATHMPGDSRHQLVVSEHTYGRLAPCSRRCRDAILRVHRRHPVVIDELGETDCGHSYIDRFMQFFDANGIGYVGWAWNAGGGWTCRGGPSLITDYGGIPTPYGVGFRDHLRALGVPPGPAENVRKSPISRG